MSCLLCHSTQSETVSRQDRHGKSLVTKVCQGCGLVFNDPIPSDVELSKFYSEDYRMEYKGAHKPRKRQILRNFRRARDHVNQFKDIFDTVSSVLDIGAGSGEFLFSMAHAGKKAEGIEPNRQYAEYCRESLDLDVRTLELAPNLFANSQFDFIRLNHVMEHMNDPVAKLKMISGFMKDDGILFLEVPNIEHYAVTKSRGNMFHFGHIFNFNPWTLRATARLAGLVEDERTITRCTATTGIFLKKTPDLWSAEDVTNEKNAHLVMDFIERHYQNSFGAKNVAKPFKKLAKYGEETIASWRYDDPKEIGAAVLGAAIN